jgi:hypothetical protein
MAVHFRRPLNHDASLLGGICIKVKDVPHLKTKELTQLHGSPTELNTD